MHERAGEFSVFANGIRAGLTPHLALETMRRSPGALGQFADHIDRLAADAQLTWHRTQLRAARRLPVHMLVPLITLVLPSFMLLTITPVMFGAIESIRGAL